ncbi:hypothetical protein [Effusibacillus lacus]|uniref:hypothetical protein n=1 Tax=Effusibacillus lacus TaxID=1348429 RepID=UPI0010E0B000|nr:hypothetical protein [Effusibacillus lacus]TCS75449.1 hypothetical protein EDD64_1074 [Effusibacillus lacus]
MIAQDTIILQGTRLATGEFFLWATGEKGVSIFPERLKTQLFAWDRRSFYGAMIDIAERDGRAGVLPLRQRLFISWRPHPTHCMEQSNGAASFCSYRKRPGSVGKL